MSAPAAIVSSSAEQHPAALSSSAEQQRPAARLHLHSPAVEKMLVAVRSIVIDQSTLVRRAMEAPMLYGTNQAGIKLAVEEYCRFLVLKAHAKDTNARFLSPSGLVSCYCC